MSHEMLDKVEGAERELDIEGVEEVEESAVDSFDRMRQKAVGEGLEGEVGGEALSESIAPLGWDDESGDFVISEEKAVEAQKAAERKVMRESRNLAANIGNFGLFLLLAVVAGYFIGNFIDEFLGTKPVFTVFWVVCGIAASVKELMANLKAAQKLADAESEDVSRASVSEKTSDE